MFVAIIFLVQLLVSIVVELLFTVILIFVELFVGLVGLVCVKQFQLVLILQLLRRKLQLVLLFIVGYSVKYVRALET